jgi:hypothetical protein
VEQETPAPAEPAEPDLVDPTEEPYQEPQPAQDLLGGPNWAQMQDDLTGLFAMFGAGMGMVLSPTGGRVMMNRAPKAAGALIDMARHDPRLAAFLERFLARARFAALGEVVGEVVIAVGVDRGVIPPTSPITTTIQLENAETIQQVRAEQQAQAEMQAQAEALEREAAARAAAQRASAAPPMGVPAPEAQPSQPTPNGPAWQVPMAKPHAEE